MIEQLKGLESELKEINHQLICEKRKTYKQKLMVRKRKLLKEIKQLKHELVLLHKQNKLDVWLIDITSVSVLPLSMKKNRYLRNYKYHNHNQCNLLVAYNFKDGYGYALLVKHNQIIKKDLDKLLRYLPKNAITITDNRHKYTVEKVFTMKIERLFSWIKKPIYTQIKHLRYSKVVKGKRKIFHKLSINQLLDMYKAQLQKYNITPINF